MIKLLYGGHYNIKKLMTETDDVGHSGASRERVYLILSHKRKTVEIADPVAVYEKIRNFIRQSIQTTPSDYMVSSDSEVLREAAQLAVKRGMRAPVTRTHEKLPV